VKLDSHKPTLQFARYVLVGGFNTVFGFCVFAFLNWFFQGLGSFSYMYAWALANVIAITAAFLAYKWFVFRTRGSYLAEWTRCFGVYGSGILFGLVALPITVTLLRKTLHRPEEAPYLAMAALTVVTVVLSFLGHKHFSFRDESGGEDAKKAPNGTTS
jgi:putative flippase GtrA